MKTVLITGAGGFIARQLAPELQQSGMRVVGVSHSRTSVPGFDAVHPGSLGDALPAALQNEQLDAVIHAALENDPGSYEVNVNGTLRWSDEARRQGTHTQIFLSSISAGEAALSDYGRAKYALEEHFIASGEIVFRLGVVIGPDGMFGNILQSLRRSPIIPLLGGGRQFIPIVGVDALKAVLISCIANDGAGLRSYAWRVYQSECFSLREVLEAAAQVYGFKRVFVPVPIAPVLWVLERAESLSIKLPIRSVNVRGLMQAEKLSPGDDYERLDLPAFTLVELIRRARDTKS